MMSGKGQEEQQEENLKITTNLLCRVSNSLTAIALTARYVVDTATAIIATPILCSELQKDTNSHMCTCTIF